MITGEHRLALPPGFQLGKYSLQSVLGAGGFGITYLAKDSSLGRRVAIKELLPNEIATRLDGSTVVAKTKSEEDNLEWARDRFVKEGQALAACDHPNVVNVYEMIEANGTAYMVTKFEEGRSFSEWLKEVESTPTEKELRGILLPLLSGLEKVHKSGFLHRDLKPENIYLTDEGRPILLDFGSARQAISDRTTSLTSIVTSGYAPFEQYHEDGKQGAWTDIYALAAVMYRAIHGKKPPEATRRLKDDPCLKLAKQYTGKYSAQFLSSIDRALAVEPQRRPQSVAEWRQMLGAGPAREEMVPPTWWQPWLKKLQEKFDQGVELAKAKPLWAAGAAVGLLVLVVALGRYALHEKPVPEPIANVSPSPSGSARGQTAPVVISPQDGGAESGDLIAMIARAAPGATIKVPPGTYPGGLVIGKAVRLVSTAGQVYIQSEGRECLSVRAPGVVVQNVQFMCNGIGELAAISVADGAALELEACKIQSGTAVAVSIIGNASLKALSSAFGATNGTAVRLSQQAHGSFTQCSFAESVLGLWIGKGATAEMHSCAFDRNGGADAKGGIVSLSGTKSTLTAEDCHFTNNAAGISVADRAALTITNSSFKNNGGTPRGAAMLGLVFCSGSTAKVVNTIFDSNQQGVLISDGSTVEIEKCQFTGNGVGQTRDFIPSRQPISVYGKGAVATLRNSVITDSAQYAADAMAGAKLIMEDVEISGTRTGALVVGDRIAGPGQAEVKRCHFSHNGTGIGIFAGSSATVEDSECSDNQEGIIVLDKESRLNGNKLTIASNRDCGLYVHANGAATIRDSEFRNNERGAVSGTRGKASERASVTLENCRFGGNKTFGAGACAQSELILVQCVFDGSDKANIYKEHGAIVQTDAIADASPIPSNAAESTATPQPSASGQIHRRPRPKPRPNGGDVSRIIRQFLPRP